jgi:hypothetical protein
MYKERLRPFRQGLLFAGVIIFGVAGLFQLGMVASGRFHGWDAWLGPFVSWTVAYLAHRESRKFGDNEDDHIR